MKRIKWIFSSIIFAIFFIPSLVFAEGTDRFYIDLTILDNGDIEVKEAISLTGEYNGSYRDIIYQNPYAYPFTVSTKLGIKSARRFNCTSICAHSLSFLFLKTTKLLYIAITIMIKTTTTPKIIHNHIFILLLSNLIITNEEEKYHHFSKK